MEPNFLLDLHTSRPADQQTCKLDADDDDAFWNGSQVHDCDDGNLIAVYMGG